MGPLHGTLLNWHAEMKLKLLFCFNMTAVHKCGFVCIWHCIIFPGTNYLFNECFI